MHTDHSNTSNVLGMLVVMAMSEKPARAWTILEASVAGACQDTENAEPSAGNRAEQNCDPVEKNRQAKKCPHQARESDFDLTHAESSFEYHGPSFRRSRRPSVHHELEGNTVDGLKRSSK